MNRIVCVKVPGFLRFRYFYIIDKRKNGNDEGQKRGISLN